MSLTWLLVGCAYQLGPPSIEYAAVPAELALVQPSTDRRRWYVPVEVEGLGEQLFFVDTGYSYSTCDDDLIAGLDLGTKGRVVVHGELGDLVTTKAVLPQLRLGGHVVEGLVCQVRDLGSTSSIDDPDEVPVAGVLGMDVLRGFRVVFDPSEGRMTLTDPRLAAALRLHGLGAVPLRREGLFGTRSRALVLIDGRQTWPVVDTGATDTYIDGARLGLTPDTQTRGARLRGSGGQGSTRATLLHYEAEVSVGGVVLEQVQLTDRPRSAWRPGLLGLDVLGFYRQSYDFQRGVALFERVEGQDLPPWSPGLGLGAELGD